MFIMYFTIIQIKEKEFYKAKHVQRITLAHLELKQ